MSIASGYKKFKKYILTSSGFQLVSHWTKANTLEFDDGKTAQDKLGAIDGISSSRESNSDKIAASTALVSELNSDLGGVQFISEGSGANAKYYAQLGADSASKKLLGKTVYDLGTGPIFDISQIYPGYNKLSAADFYTVLESFYASGGGKSGGDTDGYTYATNTGSISKSYNPSTGVLTLDNLSISATAQGRNNDGSGRIAVYVNMKANVTIRVFLII